LGPGRRRNGGEGGVAPDELEKISKARMGREYLEEVPAIGLRTHLARKEKEWEKRRLTNEKGLESNGCASGKERTQARLSHRKEG